MSSPAHFQYFIVTKKPDWPQHITAGRLCYIDAAKYHRLISSDHLKLPVFMVGSCSSLDYPLDVGLLQDLSLDEAQLLQALPSEGERLEWFRERHVLQGALGLLPGTEVTVEDGERKLRGCVRFMGQTTTPQYPSPISGAVFGIELQGSDRGKGNSNGTVSYKSLFTCERNCGLFVPFTKVRPLAPSSPAPPVAKLESEALTPGDRVTYFIDDECRHGMVVDLQEENGQQMVTISTDVNEKGQRGGEVNVPLAAVAKGEVPAEPESADVDAEVDEPREGAAAAASHSGLSWNSLVEVSLGSGNSYGIIRWIGQLPGRSEAMAGLELEEERGVSDGTFKQERYFHCPPKRALFVKLFTCRPDSRFQSLYGNHGDNIPEHGDTETDADSSLDKLETVPPISSQQVERLLIGRMKGIQGHCNSCYMDAALFSLFSCSSVLDSMLFKVTTPEDAAIQNTLLHHIVNPLRKRGFVEGRHVMKLRQQLQNHGYSHSFTTEEKDPEEFLIVIMHHILALDPLLKLLAASKVQESYCYQIFLDQNHTLVLPTVQQLLEHSFHSAGLKLAEVPSCLILQMPRFGKKFKMFDKIVPSLELDITDLLSEGPQQCVLCGNLALEVCVDCFSDPVFSSTGFKVFCRSCSTQVHGHPQRRDHRPDPLEVPEGYQIHGAPGVVLIRDKLELFAVLCIETSHYVSFVKHGPNNTDWIFFDSMADREGERDGFNIPEVHACPEVAAYLEMSPVELANQAPRDMKGVAKRLFCDAYMYLYQSTSMCLYR